MNLPLHKRIQILLDETSDHFSSSGRVNADYPEFAARALCDFQTILHNPNLTQGQFLDILRDGMGAHKARKSPECWSSFVAKHLVRSVNGNYEGCSA